MSEGKRIAEIIIKLKRLAEDQRGMPEGEAALRKIAELVEKYREHTEIKVALTPFWMLTMRDVSFMRRHGMSTDGSWEGRNINDAIRKMCEDYCRRIVDFMVWKGVMDGAAIEGDGEILALMEER